jgi:hypothetical protein
VVLQLSHTLQAYSNAKPLSFLKRNFRGAISSGGKMRMTLEVATPTEEPQANIVEVVAPSLAIKQYSSSRVSSINLLKNCLGAGVFSLNARVSAISANPVTIIPAAALVLTMAMWATYNFYMVSYHYYQHQNTSLTLSKCVPISPKY